MLSVIKFFVFSIGVLVALWSCGNERPHTIKDLDENMIDLKAYQENMGDELKAGKLKDAEWLLEGMDSVLLEVSRKFDEHRKLSEPFSYFYKDRMKKPIGMIRDAIAADDTAAAMKGYRLLVKNCNNCHIDHDIDKQVKY
ncbi:MAG TPA: hypothetical protein VFV31_05750 [Chitinophagaceae bacterium]|nr:hypothetical protein [Chitinophagaceae bacterium]